MSSDDTDLEQIVPLSDTFRASFKEALKQQINKVAKELMGIEVTAVDIGQIKIPAEAEDRLLKNGQPNGINRLTPRGPKRKR